MTIHFGTSLEYQSKKLSPLDTVTHANQTVFAGYGGFSTTIFGIFSGRRVLHLVRLLQCRIWICGLLSIVMDELTTQTDEEIVVCTVIVVVAIYNCLMHEVLSIALRCNRLCSRSFTLEFHEKRTRLRSLVYSNDNNCYNLLCMYRNTFDRLCSMLDEIGGLKPTKHMLVDEQVAMCLNILAHHAKNRVIQWNFGRSGATISKYFYVVLKAIIRLNRVLYKTPTPIPEDSTDQRWKWFKMCAPKMRSSFMFCLAGRVLFGHVASKYPKSDITWLTQGQSEEWIHKLITLTADPQSTIGPQKKTQHWWQSLFL
ncbi:protein ALP1-like [Senna tora]|uniref:Protein ALP1-like n=1 Tax=Senna tora TaxID=362788 RepID=A0A834SV53_9FABA|nr:protein ALP1-like [Senna tora]